MAITLELLDSDGKENDITLLTGKNVLLKFIAEDSVFFSEKGLQGLIKTPNLLNSDFFKKTLRGKELSEELEKELSEAIRFQELVINLGGKRIFPGGYSERKFKKTKDDVISISRDIRKIEKEIKSHLPKNNPLFFCPNCSYYLANSIETLPSSCTFCNKKTEEEKQTFVSYLDKKIISYLNGFWFEDYMAKILETIGWKIWCHGKIMGSSGIYHPVDILAINLRIGRILVGECKSGSFKGKDIFNFAAQYFDIKSSYGLFFALKGRPDSKGKEYMDKTPGLALLDNLDNLNDEEISKKIEESLGLL